MDPFPVDRMLIEVMDQMEDSIIITDCELDLPGPTIVYVNPALCEYTGYTAEKLIGKTPRIFQGKDSNREALDRLKRELRETNRFSGGHSRNYQKDGTPYEVEWYILPVYAQPGLLTHYLAVQRNFSDPKEGSIDFEEMRRKIDEMLARYTLKPNWRMDDNE